jgi:hypothetical protein
LGGAWKKNPQFALRTESTTPTESAKPAPVFIPQERVGKFAELVLAAIPEGSFTIPEMEKHGLAMFGNKWKRFSGEGKLAAILLTMSEKGVLTRSRNENGVVYCRGVYYKAPIPAESAIPQTVSVPRDPDAGQQSED